MMTIFQRPSSIRNASSMPRAAISGVSAETKKAAEKAAKDDFRTVSSLVEKLLVEYLREKGYLRR
jgi:hypothetical protein